MQGNVNIPDSNITTNLTFRQLVLMNMQQLTNFPYIEQDFDALTDYELLCLVVKFLNDVIANQNEQNTSITNLYNSFLALQTYVNNTKDTLEDAFNNLDNYVRNYFNNLDVQDEINNKLDAMAESGQLTDIIAQYLGLAGIIAFDTVAEMKLATNLVNGSKCKTLGFHSVNDNGDAFYKIRELTSDDTIDERYLIGLYDNTLVAELIIKDYITPEVLGAYGDNDHDDTTPVQLCLSDTNYMHAVLSKNYKISTALSVPDYKFVDGGGSIHSSTSCFLLDGFNHITIRDLKLYPELHGIHIRSNSGHCNYNLFENIFCYGANTTDSKGLFIETTTNYINEFTYRNLVFWNFKYGIYATSETESSPEMSKHTFYDCSTETAKTAGQYIKNGQVFTFYNCRHVETISNIWITEGTCNELLIIGGPAMFNGTTSMQFSDSTNGEIFGGLRYAGVSNNRSARNGYIINGKVVPVRDAVWTDRINVANDMTISYGQQIYLYYNFNGSTNNTLTLPTECYGGAGKINEFFVRTAKDDNTSTVVIGTQTKVLPAGNKLYRFSLNTLTGSTNWFVEEITNVI